MANYNGRATQVIDREAEMHNAQINDMYALLRNSDSAVLEQLWAEAKAAPRASVVAPEKPANTPTHEHTPVQSDIFTPSRLDKTLERNARVYTPAQGYAPTVTPVVKQEESVSFSLTSAAKKAIAIFASAATIMLTAICVNTQLINNREAEIARLEARNASARIELAQIQADIEHYSSEEVIFQWAAENNLK
jgi:hypothetical protein